MYEEAFNIYERSKARIFLSTLSLKSSLIRSGVGAGELKDFSSISKKVKILEKKINGPLVDIDEMILVEKEYTDAKKNFQISYQTWK